MEERFYSMVMSILRWYNEGGFYGYTTDLLRELEDENNQ